MALLGRVSDKFHEIHCLKFTKTLSKAPVKSRKEKIQPMKTTPLYRLIVDLKSIEGY